MTPEQQLEMAANMQKGLGPIFAIYGVVLLLIVVAMWKVFTKAGKPGWAAIVPIYNIIVMLEIANKPVWWIVLFFVPIANIIVGILICIALAEAFGKGAGFGLGIAFLGFIFFPILGFGSAQYRGPAAKPAAAVA
jgi:hypothetical protein